MQTLWSAGEIKCMLLPQMRKTAAQETEKKESVDYTCDSYPACGRRNGHMLCCSAFSGKRENQKIVSDFLEAYIALEEETSSEYLYQTDSDILSEELAFSELQKSLAQKLSYEITGASLEEGYGHCEYSDQKHGFSGINGRDYERNG
mgnify:CR=1 FL=1